MVDKYEKYKHNIVLCFDLASTQFTEELQEDIDDCCAEILKCIDKLKEYEKIGTVEKFEHLSKQFEPHNTDETSCNLRNCNKCDMYRKENEKYHAIGTIEEFKALKEKNVAKKPILVTRGFVQFYPCPNSDCSNPTVYKQVFPKQKYCVYCGQKLDWNTDKEETVQTIGYADQSGLMSAT